MTIEGKTFERSADERGRISLPTSKAANKRFKIKVVKDIDYSKEIDMDELENWESEDNSTSNMFTIFSAIYTKDDLTYIAVHEHSQEEYFYVEGQIKSGNDSATTVTLPGEYDEPEEAVKAAKEWMKKNDKNLG